MCFQNPKPKSQRSEIEKKAIIEFAGDEKDGDENEKEGEQKAMKEDEVSLMWFDNILVLDYQYVDFDKWEYFLYGTNSISAYIFPDSLQN